MFANRSHQPVPSAVVTIGQQFAGFPELKVGGVTGLQNLIN